MSCGGIDSKQKTATICPQNEDTYLKNMGFMFNNHSQRRNSRYQRNGYASRGRNNNSNNNTNARNFESNGPSNFRVRGKPIQIHDKYVQLARDSASNGDKILTENLLQHAEHYLRLQNNASERTSEKSPERSQSADSERDASYRSNAPRSNSRRRWAVSPEAAASSANSDSEANLPQAEVESIATNNSPQQNSDRRDEENDYGYENEQAYE